jgi:hypothetical protein
VSEQSADETVIATAEVKGRYQICDDGVIVASVEGHIAAAAVGESLNHIEGLIAIEWSDFDCYDAGDFKEALPESAAQLSATYGWLKVEANERQDGSEFAAVGEELFVAGGRKCGEGHKSGVIAKRMEQSGFGDCLAGGTTDAADLHDGLAGAANFFGGECKDGLEQVNFGPANCKLRGVDSDSNSAGTSVKIVPRECSLTSFIEPAGGVQSQWVSGDYKAIEQP